MDLDLRKRHKRQLDWYPASNRERSANDRQTIRHLVFPSLVNGDALDILGSVLARSGNHVDGTHGLHSWREFSGAVNGGLHAPDNRTVHTLQRWWGVSWNGE